MQFLKTFISSPFDNRLKLMNVVPREKYIRSFYAYLPMICNGHSCDLSQLDIANSLNFFFIT
jgi:hypothetical protein